MKEHLSWKTRFLNLLRRVFLFAPFEKVLVSLSQGKSDRSFTAKLLPSHYLYKKPSMRKGTRHGFNFAMDVSDSVDWYLYYGLDEPAHESLYRLCKKDSIIFDIGTNNGAVLLQLSKYSPQGFVYGFEPDPSNYKRCLDNIALNNSKNIKVTNVGLGSQRGEGVMEISDEYNYGMNKIKEGQVQGTVIKIVTLDEFVASENIQCIDLIKIDTEGFEFKVLKGGISVLQKFKPALFIEVNDNNLREQGSSADELVAFLIDLGYTVNRADLGTKVDIDYNFTNCHFDIVAV